MRNPLKKITGMLVQTEDLVIEVIQNRLAENGIRAHAAINAGQGAALTTAETQRP